jgi:hypothetical protein
LMKNYEVRHINRAEEIDGLKEAQAILGASGGGKKDNPAVPKDEPVEPPLPGGEEAAGVEEEAEEAARKGAAVSKEVPEGVKITGPGGETAVVSMASGSA